MSLAQRFSLEFLSLYSHFLSYIECWTFSVQWTFQQKLKNNNNNPCQFIYLRNTSLRDTSYSSRSLSLALTFSTLFTRCIFSCYSLRLQFYFCFLIKYEKKYYVSCYKIQHSSSLVIECVFFFFVVVSFFISPSFVINFDFISHVFCSSRTRCLPRCLLMGGFS